MIGLMFIIVACAKPKPAPVSIEDNPVHHYLQGMEAIEKGKIKEAENHFDRALYLDKNYSPALAGKSLVLAIKAGKQKDIQHKAVDMKKMFSFLKRAKKKADDDSQKFIYHVTAIRVYTESHPKDWLENAEDHYKDALKLKKVDEAKLPYYQTISAAHYFMGLAYYKAYKFKKAEETFAKVISDKPDKWHDKADNLYKKVQKIVRACAQYTLTDVAKKIAVKDKVTKGDVAALLVDELHLDRFLAGRIPIKSHMPKADFIPNDILNHPFKDEIITVIKWNIRGLQAQYDPLTKAYLFEPQKPIKRKELAFILEDLLIKLTGNEHLATAYFGTEKSPFPDVPVNVAWFNAVMNVTTRGLMEPDLSGEFRPDEYVDGAELILALMKLRNVMNIY
ncbi:MAG: S-layer homology domain-containing protein [Thermodesulfobacteriota bacterium]|nr:MAG: S-layer homology domain-containing protein [Thermodesulfobacteriota bacterium]